MKLNINKKDKKSGKFFSIGIITSYLFITVALLNASLLKAQWPQGFGPGFEIQNKAKEAIGVGLIKNGNLESYSIGPNSKKSVTISPKDDLLIEIKSSSKGNHRYLIEAPNTTKYLTWNPEKFNTAAKYLYPQTGTYAGYSGKSESGYNLSKNVTQADIKYLSPKR